MAVSMKKGGKSQPSWAKTGNAAKNAMAKEDAKKEQQQEQQNKLRRHWMPKNTETQMTFLDGALDDDGVLDALVFYEHQVFMNGNWRNWFVCTQDSEPCPICEGGDNPSLVGVFTAIDHAKFEYNGKHYQNTKKMFVAKAMTMKQLQKIAAKRGGLTGATFDVSRTGDKSAGVGDMFDFTEKRSLAQLKKAYPDVKDWEPGNYAEEIVYRDADELRTIGFGTNTSIGNEAPLDQEADGVNPADDM